MNTIIVYIVLYKTPQHDTLVGAVYSTLEAAKAEADRLDRATPTGSALVVERTLEELER
jgi:hypothetical protein